MLKHQNRHHDGKGNKSRIFLAPKKDPARRTMVIIASAREAVTGPRSSHLNRRLLTTRSGQETPKKATAYAMVITSPATSRLMTRRRTKMPAGSGPPSRNQTKVGIGSERGGGRTGHQIQHPSPSGAGQHPREGAYEVVSCPANDGDVIECKNFRPKSPLEMRRRVAIAYKAPDQQAHRQQDHKAGRHCIDQADSHSPAPARGTACRYEKRIRKM
jgi:hypothetical protein